MNPRTHHPVHRALAALVLASFLLSETALAGVLEAPPLPVRPLDRILEDPTFFEVPAESVTLKEVHQGTKPTFIIHIQDAHTNLSGQQNLAAALESLMERYGVSLILSEGGARDCSLTPLKKIAPPDVWKRLAKKYLFEGKLSGEEYLNLVSDRPMKIMGIERMELYLRSVENYGKLTDQREGILEYLKRIESGLQKLKTRLYPAELRAYEAGLGGLGNESKTFEGGFETLIALASRFGVALEPYPNLAKLTVLGAAEKRIDFDLANLEQAALIEEIMRRGGQEEIERHLQGAGRMKDRKLSQFAYFQNTFKTAEEKKIDLGAYPNLKLYADYLKDFSSIDLDEVLDEMVRAEDAVYRAALTDEDARLIRSIDRYVRLLWTAHNIQMSTKEFEFFRANEPDFGTLRYLAFINRKLSDLGFYGDLVPYRDTLEEGKTALEAFYASVTERDYAFIANTERMLQSEGQRVAVLISGGYHTPHLKKLFREKGYSYAVLTPVITQETNQAKYEKLLLEPVRGERREIRTVQGQTRKPDRSLSELETDVRKKKEGVRTVLAVAGLLLNRSPRNSRSGSSSPFLRRLALDAVGSDPDGARLAEEALDEITRQAAQEEAPDIEPARSEEGARLAEIELAASFRTFRERLGPLADDLKSDAAAVAAIGDVLEWMAQRLARADTADTDELARSFEALNASTLLRNGYLLSGSLDPADPNFLELFSIESSRTLPEGVAVFFANSLTREYLGQDALSPDAAGWSSPGNNYIVIVPRVLRNLRDEVESLAIGTDIEIALPPSLESMPEGDRILALGRQLRLALATRAFPEPTADTVLAAVEAQVIRHELEHEARRRELLLSGKTQALEGLGLVLEEEAAELATASRPDANRPYELLNLVSRAVRQDAPQAWSALARLQGTPVPPSKEFTSAQKLSLLQGVSSLAERQDAALQASALAAFAAADREWRAHYGVSGARLSATEPVTRTERAFEALRGHVVSPAEFDAFLREQNLITPTSSAGTYGPNDEGHYFYIKRQYIVATAERARQILLITEHLTSLGIFHPRMRWGIRQAPDGTYQVFGLGAGLDADLEFQKGLRGKERGVATTFGSGPVGDDVIEEWLRRADSAFTMEGPPAADSLAWFLIGSNDSTHPDNWGRDPETGIRYPVDIEVLSYLGEQTNELIDLWHGRLTAGARLADWQDGNRLLKTLTRVQPILDQADAADPLERERLRRYVAGELLGHLRTLGYLVQARDYRALERFVAAALRAHEPGHVEFAEALSAALQRLPRIPNEPARNSVLAAIERIQPDGRSAVLDLVSALRRGYDVFRRFAHLVSLGEKGRLSAAQASAALVLVPRVFPSAISEAGAWSRRLTAIYRTHLVREAFADTELDPSRRSLIEGVYLRMFADPSEARVARVIADAGVDRETALRLESRFTALKGQLSERRTALNVRLTEKGYGEDLAELEPFFGLETPLAEPLKSLRQTLSERAGLDASERLRLAQNHFRAVYDIELAVPFTEKELHEAVGERVAATDPEPVAFAGPGDPRLFDRLMQLDEELAILPTELALESLTVQRIVAVRLVRAFWRHEENYKKNSIVLELDGDPVEWKRTLRHELGHTLHGIGEGFATYVDAGRVRELILKHETLLRQHGPEILVRSARDNKITPANAHVFFRLALQAVYSSRLQDWKRFNAERLGITDLNQVPDQRSAEEISKIASWYAPDGNFRSDPPRERARPPVELDYIFVRPQADAPLQKNRVRPGIDELVAESTAFYSVSPRAFQDWDPALHDLLSPVLGQYSDALEASFARPLGARLAMPRPEDLQIVKMAAAEGVWQLVDSRTGLTWFYKANGGFQDEILGYRVAAELGVNVPPFGALEVGRIAGIPFATNENEDAFTRDQRRRAWQDFLEETEEGERGILTQDAKTLSDDQLVPGSGIEGILAFLAFTGGTDFGLNNNIEQVRGRFTLYDIPTAAVEDRDPDEFGYASDLVAQAWPEIDAQRLEDAIARIEALSDERLADLVRQSGFEGADATRLLESFAENRSRTREITARALVDSLADPTGGYIIDGFPMRAAPIRAPYDLTNPILQAINDGHYDDAIRNAERVVDRVLVATVGQGNAAAFLELAGSSERARLFALEQNPYLRLNFETVRLALERLSGDLGSYAKLIPAGSDRDRFDTALAGIASRVDGLRHAEEAARVDPEESAPVRRVRELAVALARPAPDAGARLAAEAFEDQLRLLVLAKESLGRLSEQTQSGTIQGQLARVTDLIGKAQETLKEWNEAGLGLDPKYPSALIDQMREGLAIMNDIRRQLRQSGAVSEEFIAAGQDLELVLDFSLPLKDKYEVLQQLNQIGTTEARDIYLDLYHSTPKGRFDELDVDPSARYGAVLQRAREFVSNSGVRLAVVSFDPVLHRPPVERLGRYAARFDDRTKALSDLLKGLYDRAVSEHQSPERQQLGATARTDYLRALHLVALVIMGERSGASLIVRQLENGILPYYEPVAIADMSLINPRLLRPTGSSPLAVVNLAYQESRSRALVTEVVKYSFQYLDSFDLAKAEEILRPLKGNGTLASQYEEYAGFIVRARNILGAGPAGARLAGDRAQTVTGALFDGPPGGTSFRILANGDIVNLNEVTTLVIRGNEVETYQGSQYSSADIGPDEQVVLQYGENAVHLSGARLAMPPEFNPDPLPDGTIGGQIYLRRYERQPDGGYRAVGPAEAHFSKDARDFDYYRQGFVMGGLPFNVALVGDAQKLGADEGSESPAIAQVTEMLQAYGSDGSWHDLPFIDLRADNPIEIWRGAAPAVVNLSRDRLRAVRRDPTPTLSFGSLENGFPPTALVHRDEAEHTTVHLEPYGAASEDGWTLVRFQGNIGAEILLVLPSVLSAGTLSRAYTMAEAKEIGQRFEPRKGAEKRANGNFIQTDIRGNVIGREGENRYLPLADYNMPSHGVFTKVAPGVATLEDMGSRNGIQIHEKVSEILPEGQGLSVVPPGRSLSGEDLSEGLVLRDESGASQVVSRSDVSRNLDELFSQGSMASFSRGARPAELEITPGRVYTSYVIETRRTPEGPQEEIVSREFFKGEGDALYVFRDGQWAEVDRRGQGNLDRGVRGEPIAVTGQHSGSVEIKNMGRPYWVRLSGDEPHVILISSFARSLIVRPARDEEIAGAGIIGAPPAPVFGGQPGSIAGGLPGKGAVEPPLQPVPQPPLARTSRDDIRIVDTPVQLRVEGDRVTLIFGGQAVGTATYAGIPLVLGRNKGSSFRPPDDRVSREHAAVFERGGEWYIQDLGSSNGTYVNGEKIARETRLDMSGARLAAWAPPLMPDYLARIPDLRVRERAKRSFDTLRNTPKGTVFEITFLQYDRATGRSPRYKITGPVAALQSSNGMITVGTTQFAASQVEIVRAAVQPAARRATPPPLPGRMPAAPAPPATPPVQPARAAVNPPQILQQIASVRSAIQEVDRNADNYWQVYYAQMNPLRELINGLNRQEFAQLMREGGTAYVQSNLERYRTVRQNPQFYGRQPVSVYDTETQITDVLATRAVQEGYFDAVNEALPKDTATNLNVYGTIRPSPRSGARLATTEGIPAQQIAEESRADRLLFYFEVGLKDLMKDPQKEADVSSLEMALRAVLANRKLGGENFSFDFEKGAGLVRIETGTEAAGRTPFAVVNFFDGPGADAKPVGTIRLGMDVYDRAKAAVDAGVERADVSALREQASPVLAAINEFTRLNRRALTVGGQIGPRIPSGGLNTTARLVRIVDLGVILGDGEPAGEHAERVALVRAQYEAIRIEAAQAADRMGPVSFLFVGANAATRELFRDLQDPLPPPEEQNVIYQYTIDGDPDKDAAALLDRRLAEIGVARSDIDRITAVVQGSKRAFGVSVAKSLTDEKGQVTMTPLRTLELASALIARIDPDGVLAVDNRVWAFLSDSMEIDAGTLKENVRNLQRYDGSFRNYLRFAVKAVRVNIDRALEFTRIISKAIGAAA